MRYLLTVLGLILGAALCVALVSAVHKEESENLPVAGSQDPAAKIGHAEVVALPERSQAVPAPKPVAVKPRPAAIQTVQRPKKTTPEWSLKFRMAEALNE